MLLNCGVGEDSWESLGLQGDPTSPFWRRSAPGFGRNDAKAETPVLWPPHVKSWLIGKDSDAGRNWGQEEKGMTEDEMAGWHHWLDGRESGGLHREILANRKRRNKPIILTLLQRTEDEGALPRSFYMATAMLASNPEKETTEKRTW